MVHNKSTYMYTCSKLLNVWPCRGITSETGWSFFLSSLCSFSQFFNIKNIKIWEREELQSLEKYQQGASLLNEVMADSKDQKSSTSLESRMNWCLQKKKKGFREPSALCSLKMRHIFWSFDKVCQYFIKLCFLYVIAKKLYYWHAMFTLKILLEIQAWTQR